MSEQRDYDAETKDADGHSYAYNFDFDVMHKYMVRSFEPFFQPGNLLELGSFKGDFTRRLQPFFDDLPAVAQSSGLAIEEAKARLGEGVASSRPSLRGRRAARAL